MSGQLKLIESLISDCKAAGEAEASDSDMKKLKEIEEDQLKEFFQKTTLNRIS